MTKKWIAINVMLLVCAGLLGWQLYVSAKNFRSDNDPSRIQPLKKKSAPDGGLAPPKAAPGYAEAQYAAITDQNLFTESRSFETTDDTPVVVETPALDIKPILVGVMISGSQRLAMINDPAPARGAPAEDRRTQTVHLGDTYRGYVVTDITRENIVLELGSRKEIIPLYDTSKPTAAGKTPIVPTRVVNFGPATAQQASNVAVVINTQPDARRGGAAPATTTRTNQPGNTGRSSGRGGERGQQQQQQQTPVAIFQGNQQPQTWNQTIDSQGRVIVNSPFGSFPVQIQTKPPEVIKK